MDVVVPVHGDASSLVHCVEGLASQTYPRERFRVLIVDNGAAPPVDANLLRRFGLNGHVVSEARRGSYAARNRGISSSTGHVVAFTDADCLPHPRWLEAGVSDLVRHGTERIAGRVVLTTSSSPTAAELLDSLFGFNVDQQVLDGWAPTANLFMTRALLIRLGGFDERLMSGGDKELGLRASNAGSRLHYSAEAMVEHPARPSSRELLRRAVRVSAGRATLATRSSSSTTVLIRSIQLLLPPPGTFRRASRLPDLASSQRCRLYVLILAHRLAQFWGVVRTLVLRWPPPRA